MQPSIIAHMTGAAIFLIAIGVIVLHFGDMKKYDIFHLIIILLLLSCAISIHGVSHAILEMNYNYNPLKSLM